MVNVYTRGPVVGAVLLICSPALLIGIVFVVEGGLDGSMDDASCKRQATR